jgi:hypothetical protein
MTVTRTWTLFRTLLLLLLLLIEICCHSVTVLLALVQTKQIRIYKNETIQKHYKQYKTQ